MMGYSFRLSVARDRMRGVLIVEDDSLGTEHTIDFVLEDGRVIDPSEPIPPAAYSVIERAGLSFY